MKRHVIADNCILSDLAKAKAAEGCHARPELLPKLFSPPILVPETVLDEMKHTSPKNVAPRTFANALPEGFEKCPHPHVVDLSMAYGFRVKEEHDVGDVHLTEHVGQWLKQGDEVLVLTNDNPLIAKLERRFPDNDRLHIKTLADVLCHAAERDLIPDAGKELTAIKDAGISTPQPAVLEKVREFQREYVDRLREERLEKGQLATQQSSTSQQKDPNASVSQKTDTPTHSAEQKPSPTDNQSPSPSQSKTKTQGHSH